ncbi:hypothetical protein TIFTF001_000613 [Ficus carica]|uniref:Uncharacterized protein n=1 Tax=Ficus carica TaxID=3494 RepID=A0AA88CNE6_FICCA|nr:hypothetical protein TIFTF001_000613 [Ficus carica]
MRGKKRENARKEVIGERVLPEEGDRRAEMKAASNGRS